MRPQPEHIEPRWPVVLAILAVLALLVLLPTRVRAFPSWVPFAVAVSMIVPMGALSLAGAKDFWLSIERMTTLAFFVAAGFGTAYNLEYLLAEMVRRSGEISGLQLLTSSIAVWVSNVLIFSLAYWRTDRGGPEARASDTVGKADWLFPQEQGHLNWRPTFVDYLFIAFCTATAFSPTEALPVSPRAKLLMMLESVISPVTIVAVAARAINILGA